MHPEYGSFAPTLMNVGYSSILKSINKWKSFPKQNLFFVATDRGAEVYTITITFRLVV